jgi:ABC-type Fe3+-hydroxamate transport system substrate-binding protein
MTADVTSPHTVVDDLGTSITVPRHPRRIVSLVPSLSEVLWWWHLADRLVGVTEYCVAPPRAFDGARRLRGTKNADVSAIIDLAPDLVVANEEENREVDVLRLRDAGIAVYVTKVRTLMDAARSLARLGEAVGVSGAGEGLAATLRRAHDGAGKQGPRLRVACPIWRDGPGKGEHETWWVIGRDTYAADLLAVAGFDVVPAPRRADLGDAGESRYPRFTLRELAAAEPDVVLLPDEPYAFTRKDAAEFHDWPAAVRHLDGTALVWWGPRTPDAIGDLDRLRRSIARRAERRHRR